MNHHYDVVIVGGGPVGMLIANELALHSTSSVVLEKRHTVSEYPKAGTYHARAISALIRRGIVASPRRTNDHLANTIEPFQFAGYPWLRLRSRTIDGPVMLGIAQADLERAITRHAESCGAHLLRGHCVTDVSQNEAGVSIRSVDAEGKDHTFSADYVIGADGGQSIVRRSGDFSFQEHAPTMRAMLGLVTLPQPDQIPNGWSHTPRGWTLLNYNPYGESRLIVFEFDGPASDRKAPVTPEEFSTAVERVVGNPVALDSPHYLNRFSDYSRIAQRYRDRRLFLAGDAAHIHYPLGGQGLNTGILDAINLGWKISAVLSGAADESLLDTYGQEREPAGQWLINNTRLQSLIMNPDPIYDPLRNFIAELLCSEETHDWLADRINGVSTQYSVGLEKYPALDGTFMPDLEVTVSGEVTSISRLLQQGKFLLIASPGALGKISLPPFTDSVAVSDGLPEDFPDVIVVRPDGYIAWAGSTDEGEAMLSCLHTCFSLHIDTEGKLHG